MLDNSKSATAKINDFYTLREEIAHSITHGVGAVLSIAGLTLLLVLAVRRGDGWQITSFAIYGVSLVILYLASTLYHSFQQPRIKRFFRVVDHASIYLLIAGTYTPFLLISLRGAWGWTYMVVIWGLAALGIVFKIFFVNRFEVLSTLAYVLMGWLSVIAMRELMQNLPPNGLLWLGAGGIVYTLGVIFFAVDKIPYNHAIWHLFVLGGSVCHFFAVFTLVPGI